MDKQFATSLLEIKSFDDAKRTFSGIATTPAPDRVGDVVEPKGAEFKLPLPFLYQHDSKRPIGQITKARVTGNGIEVEGFVENLPDAPPSLKERLDVAWAEMKSKLVRGLSIGFSPLETSFIKETGGMRFIRWSWLELSAVTIAANIEATIQTVKAIDESLRAASGANAGTKVVKLDISPPHVAGTITKPTVSRLFVDPSKGNAMKTIQEQIAGFEAKHAATVAELTTLVNKSLESGETLGAEDKTKHAEIKDTIKEIVEHIALLKESEALMVQKATPVQVESGTDGNRASESRGGSISGIIQLKDDLPPGVEFARYAKCLGVARGNRWEALQVAKEWYPTMTPLHNVLKAAVTAGTTTTAAFAGALVDYQRMATEFLEYLMPQTIIGKFGTNGIPSLNEVPFNIEVSSMTSVGTAYWVGQGKAKPVTKQGYANLTLGIAKIAALTVLTDELLRLSTPKADVLTRNALTKAVLSKMDFDFVDPAKAEVANVSPASITNGAPTFAASGTGDMDDIHADVLNAMNYFNVANMSPESLVWIMPTSVALSLSLKTNPLGQPAYPAITMRGGTFGGIPVIVSNWVTASVTSGSTIILVSANDILLADDGQIVINASREASIEMNDAPSSDAAVGTGASLVSMFQTNSTAFLAERWINWKKARADAVVYITAAQWGEA